MIRYLISDRKLYPDVVRQVRESRGVDWVQIREKDLPPRQLLDLVERVIEVARPRGIKVLVNERADVALAAGADGVHLPSKAIAPSEIRSLGIDFIGVSCHGEEELEAAAAEGASFAVLGPVFPPLSKFSPLVPLGLDRFQQIVGRWSGFRVLALGGITEDRVPGCLAAGAAGVAGISLVTARAKQQ